MIRTKTDDLIPVFIVGCYRSGTSLMRLILSTHQKIYISQETNYIDRIWMRLDCYRKDSGEYDLQRLHEDVVAYLRAERWNPLPTLQELLEWVCLNGGGYHSIVTFYGIWGAVVEGRREIVYWGDNTPRYIHCMNLLKNLFPAARFIHMVRDPRDVVASAIKLPFGGKTALGIAYDWERAVLRGVLAESVWGADQVKRVRYESLVMDPKTTIADVCEFLGVDFSEKMLDFYSTEAAKALSTLKHHSRVIEPIFQGSVGRYKRELSKSEIEIIEGYLSESMVLLEYLDEVDYLKATSTRLRKAKKMWGLMGVECVKRTSALFKSELVRKLIRKK